MLTDRHTGTLPALFAISGESRIKGFFKIRFQAIPVLKIKEQTVQTWGGALLAPPPSPREPGVHVQMWARTQRRSRLKVGFSPSFRKQGSARAGTRHGGVGAARRRPLTSLTASCADSRVGSGAARSARGRAASSLTPACGRVRPGHGRLPAADRVRSSTRPSACHWRRRVFAGGRVPSACAAPAGDSVPALADTAFPVMAASDSCPLRSVPGNAGNGNNPLL